MERTVRGEESRDLETENIERKMGCKLLVLATEIEVL